MTQLLFDDTSVTRRQERLCTLVAEIQQLRKRQTEVYALGKVVRALFDAVQAFYCAQQQRCDDVMRLHAPCSKPRLALGRTLPRCGRR